MKLPRGSALEGTLLDEFGDPAPAIRVSLATRMFAAGRMRVVQGDGPTRPASTDDRGHYRMAAIPPGDYYVMGLSGVYADPGESGGFAPTYYPGTVDGGGATAVTVPFGSDAPNVSFALVAAKTFSVTGTMVDAEGKSSGRGSLILHSRDTAGRPEMNVARAATGADSTFELRNVPQGEYALQGFAQPAPGYRGPLNLSAMSFGWLPIAIGDAPLDGVVLKVTPGTTVRGKIVLDDSAAAPPDPSQIRVQSVPLEFDSSPIGGGPAPSETHDDLTFELTHQSGIRRLMVNVASPLWTFKKITVAGIDATDQPLDLRTKDVEGVEVVLTSKVSRVAGGVTDDKGPVSDYVVVVFSADSTKWASPSRFATMGRPTQQGRFITIPLPPNDYLAIALPLASPQDLADPDFLDSLRTLATSFTLSEGETKTLELKLRRRP